MTTYAAYHVMHGGLDPSGLLRLAEAAKASGELVDEVKFGRERFGGGRLTGPAPAPAPAAGGGKAPNLKKGVRGGPIAAAVVVGVIASYQIDGAINGQTLLQELDEFSHRNQVTAARVQVTLQFDKQVKLREDRAKADAARWTKNCIAEGGRPFFRYTSVPEFLWMPGDWITPNFYFFGEDAKSWLALPDERHGVKRIGGSTPSWAAAACLKDCEYGIDPMSDELADAYKHPGLIRPVKPRFDEPGGAFESMVISFIGFDRIHTFPIPSREALKEYIADIRGQIK